MATLSRGRSQVVGAAEGKVADRGRENAIGAEGAVGDPRASSPASPPRR